MFKLAQSPAFWVAIDFEWTAENGARQRATFDARCKRMSVDEVQELQERIRSQQLDDRTVAREVVVGWRGIEGEDGGEAPFTPENFERLLNLGVGSAIVMTFFTTYPKARQKN